MQAKKSLQTNTLYHSQVKTDKFEYQKMLSVCFIGGGEGGGQRERTLNGNLTCVLKLLKLSILIMYSINSILICFFFNLNFLLAFKSLSLSLSLSLFELTVRTLLTI
jgi:hypothetical protein